METVEFGKWILEVDPEATRAAHASIQEGGALGCGCSQCLDFVAIRANLYPPRVLALLERFGVSPDKEVEVMDLGSGEPGEEVWNWWVLLVGRIASGPDVARDGWQRHDFSVTDEFSIGFTEQISLPQDGFHDLPQVVQVEFLYKTTQKVGSTDAV